MAAPTKQQKAKQHKTEWWYDWPETETGQGVYYLDVNEDSSDDELELEIEYWMGQIRDFDLQGPHKKALMGAVRWMSMMMS